MTTHAAYHVTFHENDANLRANAAGNAEYAKAELEAARRAGNTLQRRQAAQLARYWQAQVARLTPRAQR